MTNNYDFYHHLHRHNRVILPYSSSSFMALSQAATPRQDWSDYGALRYRYNHRQPPIHSRRDQTAARYDPQRDGAAGRS